MKRLSLIMAAVLGGLVAYSVATAQDTGKDAKKGKRNFSVDQRMETLTTELKLTDEQKPKVKAVLEDQAKKFQEMRDLPQDQRREKMQAAREDQTKKMKEILTPDQFEKWQKMAPFGKRGPGGEKKSEPKN